MQWVNILKVYIKDYDADITLKQIVTHDHKPTRAELIQICHDMLAAEVQNYSLDRLDEIDVDFEIL